MWRLALLQHFAWVKKGHCQKHKCFVLVNGRSDRYKESFRSKVEKLEHQDQGERICKHKQYSTVSKNERYFSPNQKHLIINLTTSIYCAT